MHPPPPKRTNYKCLGASCSSTMATGVLVLRAAIWCSVLVSACCMVAEGRRPAVLTGCRGGHGSCLKSTNASTSHINESIKITRGTASGRAANGRLRPSEPEAAAGRVDSRAVRPELRWAPSGPDPLHHNGGSPKKPQTP